MDVVLSAASKRCRLSRCLPGSCSFFPLREWERVRALIAHGMSVPWTPGSPRDYACQSVSKRHCASWILVARVPLPTPCFKAKYDHPPNPKRFQWCTNKRDCICLTFPSHFLDEVAYAVLLLLTLVSSKCRAFCSLRKRKITGQDSQWWCKCTPGPPHARVTGPREDVHSSPTWLIILRGSKMQKTIEFVFLFF